MSQHLIIDFINRTYVFKPFNDAKIVNHKIKKIQGSNRQNNVSPQMFAESTHPLHKIEVKKIKEKDPQEQTEGHIDIIV
ncbi:hypothetical protein [Psychromonas antarctica]|jgi:hypothetical protein|uniref:hypothetical protein n=1 Tax=Psychromonas antarctica TaxID=67573 RepID=UPI001EE7EF14|nr:hypothetical protein [Psychromonas antarctica]MCG6202572.1 hypothetical protein [Psychromonas antarctica]